MRYITVEGLSFQYDAEPVLDNIHYHLDSGEFVTLTGENGAAKSTLIKATLGILTKMVRSFAWPIYHSKLPALMQDSQVLFMSLSSQVATPIRGGSVV